MVKFSYFSPAYYLAAGTFAAVFHAFISEAVDTAAAVSLTFAF